ncbi:rRNA biogenesis protein rrp36 [Coemansia sp. RSA 1939]|nr:rRNA biogenesis protein rrp36 [Coemansia sp. RSA 1939]KAJ2611221.1 rRNA biogenesis protein rrp36 [Coemansia sp. RSA 1804]
MKKAQITQYSSDDDSDGSSDDGSLLVEDSDIETGDVADEQSDGSVDSEDESDSRAQRKSEAARKRLAAVPFNQLIRVQQQMGVKKFNDAMGLEQKAQRKREVLSALKSRLHESKGDSNEINDQSLDSESDSNSDSDSEPRAIKPPQQKAGRPSKRNPGEKHRRSDKNKPTVMSSKRPVGRFRQVVDIAKTNTRDPRFDGLSGNFNEDLYEKTYAFLDEKQKEEMDVLEKQAQKLKSSNPDEARKIKMVLGSMKSQASAKNQKKKQQELKRRHRKMELESAQQGKKPYFLKKRELKDLEAAERYSKLKDSSKLDGYLEKRRKRNASKDHRRMPYQRREE